MTRPILTAILLALLVAAPRNAPEPPAQSGASHGSDRDGTPPVNDVAAATSLAGGAPLLADTGTPPMPVSAVSSVQSGTATWCAPTPRYCRSWGGNARLGAVQSFRYGDRPYLVDVCLSGTERCVVVRVVSYCACGNTLIDLSPAAFKRLAPLSRGRIPVTVSSFVLPQTSTHEEVGRP